MRVCICGSTSFIAHQRCYHDVIVDGENNFKADAGIYESEKIYGPYRCVGCNAEYDELEELDKIEESDQQCGISFQVDELGKEINELEQQKDELTDQKNRIPNEISKIEKKLDRVKKAYKCELEVFTHHYMNERFGIEYRHDGNKAYLIFDSTAQFIKVYRIKKDFEYISDMEKVLVKEKLYGHNASSWYSRSREFYNLSLKEQLKILDWKFDESGNITGTEW